MNPRHIRADFKVVARSYVRNPIALFFSLIFPIILIALFGLIFSSAGGGPVTLPVVNADPGCPFDPATHNTTTYCQEFLAALNSTHVVRVDVVDQPTANFAGWLGQKDYTVGLVLPPGFGQNFSDHRPTNVTVYLNPQDASSTGTVLGAVQGVVNGFNLYAANGSAIVGFSTANIGSPVYTSIDYLIPGLIGFSILTSPMFSMVDIASSYRKEGIFRQLSLTPLSRAEWLTSRVVWYVLLTFVTAGIMIFTGIGLFGAHLTYSPGLLPFLVVGPFFFVSLGMLAGSVAKTPESAALIGNIITFPMMFLSGTFFQVSSMPPYLQTFAHVLPLYYVIDGMNQVMLFSNTAQAFTDLLIILVSSIVVFALAVRFFRWRDE